MRPVRENPLDLYWKARRPVSPAAKKRCIKPASAPPSPSAGTSFSISSEVANEARKYGETVAGTLRHCDARLEQIRGDILIGDELPPGRGAPPDPPRARYVDVERALRPRA